jgi:hypothetical protein
MIAAPSTAPLTLVTARDDVWMIGELDDFTVRIAKDTPLRESTDHAA